MSVTESKKEAFINAFILTGCKEGTKAAITAGYSPKTAAQQASRLLKDVKVQQAIQTQKKLSTKLFIKTKEQKLLILEEIMTACKVDDKEKGMINAPAVIAAIKEHNIMQGDNAPIEVSNKHAIVKADELDW
jgi:phage terminase small subunit